MAKRTCLDLLLEKAEVEDDLTKLFEIEYRIFILKTEKQLNEALKEIDSLSECKKHKDNVLRWTDYLTPCYSTFSEGEQKSYENLKTYLYSNIERPFFSIFEVDVYQREMSVQLKNALSLWWKHRENIFKLM